MRDPFLKEVLLSQVHFFIGTILLVSAALGASLIIWHTATYKNPLTDVFLAALATEAL